jgi:hypothetical protein
MVGEQSLWAQFVFLVGWVVVMLGVVIGFFAALGSVMYLVVRAYEKFLVRSPKEYATTPPWSGWPWGRGSETHSMSRSDAPGPSTPKGLSPPFAPGYIDQPISTHSLFVGLVLTTDEGDVEAYLVNNTPSTYTRVVTRTGMYSDGDGEFVESTVAVRDHGPLRLFSALLLEASTKWMRDFYIWYRVELWSTPTDEPVRADFHIPKRVWSLRKQWLPVLQKEGAVLFERRTIEPTAEALTT